jgi:hypothetical protein
MEWKNIKRLLAPAALMLALPGTVLAADCAEFEGIQHCAIGNARLSTTSAGLEVTGFRSSSDGVNIALPGATSWQMGTALKGNAAGNASLSVTAFASGSPNSNMMLQQNGQRFDISARFTGAAGGVKSVNGAKTAATTTGGTYSALVYNNGVLQGGVGNIPNGARAMYVNHGNINNPWDPEPWDPWNDPWWWPWWWWNDTGFGLVAQTGGCFHTLSSSAPIVFNMPDGRQLRGDRVELVEEVTGSGAYPYLSFDGIRVTGTVESVTITSETVRR